MTVRSRHWLLGSAIILATISFGWHSQWFSVRALSVVAPENEPRKNFIQGSGQGGPAADVAGGLAVTALTSQFPMAPFPHIALYGGANSSGWPFIGTLDPVGSCDNNPSVACALNIHCGSANTLCNNSAQRPPDGTALNTSVIDAYAKYPLTILPPTPLSDARPDILAAIKARNPSQKVFGYTMGHVTWCPQDGSGNNSYPAGYYFRAYYLAVTANDPSCAAQTNRLLWNRLGVQWGASNVNLAYRVPNGSGGYIYDVAEDLAAVMYEYSKPTRGWDGMFIDIFCVGVLWAETTNDKIDYARAGYGSDNNDPANKTAFDAGWRAGHQAMAEKLRALAIQDGHPDFPVSANCGQSAVSEMPYLNGWMRENFPHQNGGTFFSNMYTYPSGFMHQDYLFRGPQYNFIFTAAEPSATPYTTHNQDKMRFGLGSASLGNGYHVFEDGTATASLTDFEFWWFDEYGVNTAVPESNANYGQAINGQAYADWLGQPLGDAYDYLIPNANPEILPTNTFEQDLNQVQLVQLNGAQASIHRDTTTTAVGAGSLRVQIDQLGTDYTSIDVNSNVFTVANGTYYSLTFWAKADQPRGIGIAIDGAGTSIPLTTNWKKYQVSLRATATGNAIYQLQLGQAAGNIWFDHFQIQAGIGHVFRRDFDKGTVLVNPYNVALTVPLEKPYKKIKGTVNPTLNNGSVVSSVTLTPNVVAGVGDALFLVNHDPTPPAAVQDLR